MIDKLKELAALLDARDWIHANPNKAPGDMPPRKVRRHLLALERRGLIKYAAGQNWFCVCADCKRKDQ